jgi:hypothetical protein
VVFRFHARDVNLIMAPPARGAAVHFRVGIDRQSPDAARGVDGRTGQCNACRTGGCIHLSEPCR